MYQVFGRSICKTIFKASEIFLMFTTRFYKIFFKIILPKYLIKSSLTWVKFYNVVSSDNGINSLNNLFSNI